jgi:uncharacterized membrane protein
MAKGSLDSIFVVYLHILAMCLFSFTELMYWCILARVDSTVLEHVSANPEIN